MSLFPQEPYSLDLPDADVTYYKNMLTDEEAASYYKTLLEEISWRHDDIKVFGKIYPQPRLTALYSSNAKPYSYSNITMVPEPFTPALQAIKKQVEAIAGVTFTTCLLNLYRDGNDSNGWHADDEKELGKNPIIASVSLGAPRLFKFRNKIDKTQQAKIILEPGSLLLMGGSTQHNWHHQIPKTAKKVAPRINLTFRIIA
ncbi:alkylated DNA repair dioxygenase AlkB [Dokdonia sp. Hel_I_63]|jgi:alkylated DNA repair dioxygenase AlkB|uniref:alpha-ketoglutarate-dependent dioxygenase AlkB family protein n=1 Tax=Dokdonia sp. Hel_I_63 TaxID=1249996 RepID=UPI00119C448A|nr:alpha-ketoglutarate-dependent dioxygenase AlkB [Dokdonia sp. Hel_I_63]TVZ23500.1 alkylated DNA repair dioxygenase AlkB [Dokdonia sp. Hel_I_63]